jgi:hypothetical protein
MTAGRVALVHGLEDARKALAAGGPVTLLSAPGAAGFAGCGWWRALVAAARAAYPGQVAADFLDCGEDPGYALAALSIGLRGLVLSRDAPGFAAVAAIAAEAGAVLLTEPPPVDLCARDSGKRPG